MSVRRSAEREHTRAHTLDASVTHAHAVIEAARAANAAFVLHLHDRKTPPLKIGADSSDPIYHLQRLALTEKPERFDWSLTINFIKAIDEWLTKQKVILYLDEMPGEPSAVRQMALIKPADPKQWPVSFSLETKQWLNSQGARFVEPWAKACDPSTNAYVESLAAGVWNATFRIHLDHPEAPPWMRKMLGPGDLKSVVMRVAKTTRDLYNHGSSFGSGYSSGAAFEAYDGSNAPSNVLVVNLYTELAIMSHASWLKVGPKQYLALIDRRNTDKNGTPIGPLKAEDLLYKDKTVVDYAHFVASFAESFDGSCEDKVAMQCANYWQKVAETIIHASKNGFVHGDIKRANMLYKRDARTNTITHMAYTDFDPEFVKVLDVSRREVYELWPCIAMLMMMAYLTELRCKGSDGMTNSELENAVDAAMGELKMSASYRDPDLLHGALELVCDFHAVPVDFQVVRDFNNEYGARDTDQIVRVAKKEVVNALQHHANMYMLGSSRQPRCLRAFPRAGNETYAGEGTLRQLIAFALNDATMLKERTARATRG